MQKIREELERAVLELNVSTKQIDEKYSAEIKEEEDKKIKKKLKKYMIENEETTQTAVEKANKMFEELYKHYQATYKACGKAKILQKAINQCELEKKKAHDHKTMIQNLKDSFKLKYEEQLKKAQDIQKQEQDKRKAVIEELQQRIKNIQDKYEESGKIKIEKFRENETLKHELSKLEPHLIASQSLYQAQIKKKSIEIEIQMTTLKQKIEMMTNFKTMGAETEQKLKNSIINAQKINVKAKILEGKEEQHKILIAKAHLVLEDYKRALNVLKDVLPKKQKDAILIEMKVNKAKASLDQMQAKLIQLDKEYNTQLSQLQMLKNLEQTLQKQLSQPNS